VLSCSKRGADIHGFNPSTARLLKAFVGSK
jgi:hypothetical protein